MKKTSRLSLLLAVVMLLTMAFPAFAAEGDVEITLIHTNDTHSRIEAGKYAGMGFDKIATVVNQKRTEGKNVLLLDAGDTFHGQTFATISQGESIAKVMNLLKYDAMAAGNHDFNYGQERLLELSKIVEFPILGANVVKADGSNLLEKYVIKEYNGVKVGIFGLSSPETVYKTHPNNVKGLTFKNPVEEAKAMVAELKDKADIIICLGHIGLDGSTEFTSEDICKAVDGIDVFVDGHSHTDLEAGKVVNGATIVQTGEYDKNLGVVTLTYADKKLTVAPTLVTKAQAEEVEADKAMTDLIAGVKTDNEKITSVVVAKSDIELIGVRDKVRAGETNLGNLITAAMIDATGADVAITNGGGIRASIEVGDVTKGEIITVLPFGNYVVTKKISGADIKAALENGIGSYPATKGAFPHVAGMTFKFDPNLAEGSKLVEVKVNGVMIDDAKMYTLATNDFMAAGGDGYKMFGDDAIVGEFAGLDEVLIAYMAKNGTDAAKVTNRVMVYEAPVYTVVSGDVLWKIAAKYKTTAKTIAEYNNLENPNLIFPGQKILVPGK